MSEERQTDGKRDGEGHDRPDAATNRRSACLNSEPERYFVPGRLRQCRQEVSQTLGASGDCQQECAHDTIGTGVPDILRELEQCVTGVHTGAELRGEPGGGTPDRSGACLLYTSDAADEE